MARYKIDKTLTLRFVVKDFKNIRDLGIFETKRQAFKYVIFDKYGIEMGTTSENNVEFVNLLIKTGFIVKKVEKSPEWNVVKELCGFPIVVGHDENNYIISLNPEDEMEREIMSEKITEHILKTTGIRVKKQFGMKEEDCGDKL